MLKLIEEKGVDKTFNELIDGLSTKTPTGGEPKEWQCLTCQYVVVSPTLPYKCPRYGASRVKFVIKGEAGEGE